MEGGRRHFEERMNEGLENLEQEEVIKKYKPRFLSAGSHQLVFEFPEHESVVGKVDKELLARILKYNLQRNFPTDTKPPKEVIDRTLKEERERFDKLRSVFGHHVLKQRSYFLPLPVNRDLIDHAVSDRVARLMLETPVKTWALVRIQEKMPQQARSSGRSLNFRYAEDDRKLSPEIYTALNAALLDGEGRLEKPLEHPSFKPLNWVEGNQEDESMQVALVDFINRAVEYTKRYGEIIDLAGSDNVSFYPKEGEWNYALIDPLERKNGFRDARRDMEKLLNGETVKGEAWNRLLNAVNYTRTINALSHSVGMENQLKLSDRAIAPKSKELLEGLRLEW